MFPDRYFPTRYFPDRYWPEGRVDPPEPLERKLVVAAQHVFVPGAEISAIKPHERER